MAEKKQTIADAFIAWHAEEVKASKDGKNPHFRSTYSTLEEVIAACRKAGQHGLTFTQLIDMDDTGRMFVKNYCHARQWRSVDKPHTYRVIRLIQPTEDGVRYYLCQTLWFASCIWSTVRR